MRTHWACFGRRFLVSYHWSMSSNTLVTRDGGIVFWWGRRMQGAVDQNMPNTAPLLLECVPPVVAVNITPGKGTSQPVKAAQIPATALMSMWDTLRSWHSCRKLRPPAVWCFLGSGWSGISRYCRHMYLCMYVCTYTYIYICTSLHTYIWYIYTHVRTYVYIYICLHTHIRTFIHSFHSFIPFIHSFLPFHSIPFHPCIHSFIWHHII